MLYVEDIRCNSLLLWSIPTNIGLSKLLSSI